MNAKLKTILSVTWKVGLGLIGLAAAVIGILVFNVWHEETRGRNYRYDKNLSKDIAVHSFNGNRERVWNRRTERYITPKLRWVSGTPACDSITVYCDVHGNRGYLNCNTGEIVIPAEKARYRRAWQFSDGLAFVILPYPEEECLSIIDYAGNILAKNVATYEAWHDYLFVDGLCTIRVDGRYGLLSTDGTWAVEPKYYDIGREGGTGTLYRTKHHVKQLVNYDGSVVEPFVIDDTYELKYVTRYNEDEPDEYALEPDVVVYRVDDWVGLMNKHTGPC